MVGRDKALKIRRYLMIYHLMGSLAADKFGMTFKKLSIATFIIALACLCPLMAEEQLQPAPKVVAIVNGEKITDVEIMERRRWIARTQHFGERIKAILTSKATKKKYIAMMGDVNPRSPEEAHEVSDRIKKQIINEVKQQILEESTLSKVALDAIIDDRLKIQATKNLNISISDEAVEAELAKLARVDLAAFYRSFASDGISKKTIHEIYRVQLIWREAVRKRYALTLKDYIDQNFAVINRVRDFNILSKEYLEEIKSEAVVEYPNAL